MKSPAYPDNEQTRIAKIYGLRLLDTEREERFDRITRIATRIFDVPIALVTLVDANRQWFKSNEGLDVCETPRNVSFCGHAILDDRVLVVNDSLEDVRFHDNPLVVTDPKIRFYAGCPIKVESGEKVGTLCIIDRKPRKFSQQDESILRDLAAIVESELETHKLATSDELTRLLNRRGFMLLAENSLNFCRRHKVEASLVYFDLNGFKMINDTFGHAVGDMALVSFAGMLTTSFRSSDMFARLGGDEFVGLLPNTSKRQANKSIQKFSKLIGERNAHSVYRLAFSCGVVEFDPNGPASIEDMLGEGDQLMYKNKKALKNAMAAAAGPSYAG
jgi:diguanylate cyclase (GGDEF)-like protein